MTSYSCFRHIKGVCGAGFAPTNLTPHIHFPVDPQILLNNMSQTTPYAASDVALLPVINESILDAKQLTIHTVIMALNDNSMTLLILTYWPGSEPQAAGIDDTVLVSGSAHFTASNNVLMAFSEALFVNRGVHVEKSERKSLLKL
jgi:hypothetical protein